ASPGCSPTVFSGSLATGDPTLATRLFRADPQSTCAAPHVYPGTSGTGPFLYDTYNYANTTGAPQCITVVVDAQTCTGTPFIHASAYQGTFDPNNLATNYLADLGASPDPTTNPKTFSFTLPAGQSAVLVVNAVTAGTGGACAGYTLTVSGGGSCASPSPSPSVNPTRTPTPTPSASPSPT